MATEAVVILISHDMFHFLQHVFLNGSLVISNHFPCKDSVFQVITTIKINGLMHHQVLPMSVLPVEKNS